MTFASKPNSRESYSTFHSFHPVLICFSEASFQQLGVHMLAIAVSLS